MTTTPAGWYDDGSGRQRWWDGEQWTEHFAPEAPPVPTDAAPEQASSERTGPDQWAPEQTSTEQWAPEQAATEQWAPEQAASEQSDAAEPLPEVPTEAEVDSTITAAENGDGSASVDATAAPGSDSAPEAPAFSAPEAPAYGAPAAPSAPEAPSYGAPAYGAPAAPGSAPGHPSPSYPSAPGSYGTPNPYGSPAPGYGAYPGAAAAAAPQPMSVLGLVGLGLAVLGTILVCFLITAVFGWILLLGGLVVSIVSLFLRGKKWPGITGIGVSILGGIVGGIMAIVFFTLGFAQVVSDAASDYPSYSSDDYSTTSPYDEDDTDDTDTFTGDRPTADEVAVGIRAVIGSTGAEGYSEEQIMCFAEEFVASDIDDETLQTIAETDGNFTDPDAALEFSEVFADSLSVCMF